MKSSHFHRLLLVALLVIAGCATNPSATELAANFKNPPAPATPWVYWVWMDGNLSKQGITEDLEAMHRVGIGGVIIMEVDVGIPKGPVKFMSPQWQEMFVHAANEAARLGLTIDIIASPGWTGSGGPWVKPEQSMQKLVSSETTIQGGKHVDQKLPKPETIANFYDDVCVLAFPTPSGNFRIDNIQQKALYHRGHFSSESGVPNILPISLAPAEVPADQAISANSIIDLSQKMDHDGKLTWDAPPGNWTILRFGRTSTGANTRPAPQPGIGLECDKLDAAALDAHFENYLGKLITDVGPAAGKSLTSVHIDSWEMGPQNWTGRFPQEFKKRRGYDLTRYLPIMTGRVVENADVSERFLWDLRQTVLELVTENYSGHLRDLAHNRGVSLSIEPYDGTPIDDMTYCSPADMPMCEFWSNCFDTTFSTIEATSVAHIYGKKVISAEAFTADQTERWLYYPGSMKALGDWAFCAGVNRLVFHRYAHQPFPDRYPGMTMGLYGVHHERTQTWWEQSIAYHQYLARCQYILQQGLPVADICYLTPEASPQVFRPPGSALADDPPARKGYSFDGCTPDALLNRMKVHDGWLVLPDGMSYAVLVLPSVQSMTPQLLNKVKELVDAGATVIGAPPVKSPSLENYPECDEQVKKVADELWTTGKVIPAPPLIQDKVDSNHALDAAKWIWFNEGKPATAAPVGKRYFRQSFKTDGNKKIESARAFMTADNSFELYLNDKRAGSGSNFTRVSSIDIAPFLISGENKISVVAANGGETPNPAGLIGTISIQFTDGSSLKLATDHSWKSSKTSDGTYANSAELGAIPMAPWGAINAPSPVIDVFPSYNLVSDQLKRMGIAPDFQSDVPLRYIHRKIGDIDAYFISNGSDQSIATRAAFRVTGKQPQIWDPHTGAIHDQRIFRQHDGTTTLPLWLEPAGSALILFTKSKLQDAIVAIARDGHDLLPPAPLEFELNDSGLSSSHPGQYQLQFASGKTQTISITPPPSDITIKGPWQLHFQTNRGAPDQITLPDLIDWSKHSNPGVKYFSGRAAYFAHFTLPPDYPAATRTFLDLGKVQVIAQVKLNNKDIGIAWHAPYRMEITDAVHSGENTLEITVANLWPNRLIGDEQLPPDSTFNPDGAIASFPAWMLEGKPSPTGRTAFTTWKLWNKTDPLLESGLIGPVKLEFMSKFN